jgi:hypothetical protein
VWSQGTKIGREDRSDKQSRTTEDVGVRSAATRLNLPVRASPMPFGTRLPLNQRTRTSSPGASGYPRITRIIALRGQADFAGRREYGGAARP